MNAIIKKLQLRLIENWKSAYRFWSIRLGIAGTVVATFFLTFPDTALWAWNALPADLKQALPPTFTQYIGIGLFALSLLARIFKQNKLSRDVVKKVEVTQGEPGTTPDVAVTVKTVDAPQSDDAR